MFSFCNQPNDMNRMFLCWLWLLIVVVNLCEAGFLLRSLSFAIPKHSRGRESSNVAFDKNGVQLKEHSIHDQLSQSSPIVILQGDNCTLISYISDPDKKSNLQESICSSHLYSLADSSQRILITGIIGDCRLVVRHVKLLSANHLAELGALPTGSYLASKLSRFLAQKSRQGEYLTVHAFIIDNRNNVPTTIHEVSSSGDVSLVRGGAAGGRKMKAMREAMDESLQSMMQQSNDSDRNENESNHLSLQQVKEIVDSTIDMAVSDIYMEEDRVFEATSELDEKNRPQRAPLKVLYEVIRHNSHRR